MAASSLPLSEVEGRSAPPELVPKGLIEGLGWPVDFMQNATFNYNCYDTIE